MPALDEEAALGEVADDLVGRLDGREAVQPAVVVVEAAGLVDRRQHRQAERAAELEVLGAGAGRDVDDPGALLERDLVPRDDAVLDARAGREVVERALVAQADELRSRARAGRRCRRGSAPRAPTRRSRAARTRPPGGRPRRRSPAASTASSSRRRPTRRDGRAAGSGRRATGRSSPGRRPHWVSSCWESEVPQRGHQAVARWPR